MKRGFITTLIALLLIVVIPSYGQSLWQQLPGTAAPSKGQRTIIPNKYLIFSLDQSSMMTFLHQLGNEPESGSIILLPNPQGKEIPFKVWETPVMPASLQARFPNIRTYTATAVNNPYVSAKIDYTDYGFHAMIYEPGRKWIIDPYSNIPDGYYISFYQSDAALPEQPMVCEVNRNLPSEDNTEGTAITIGSPQQTKLPVIAQKVSQNIKRTYRLALSCTGEYAQAVAGANPTQSNVLSQMTTSINRVNGIYEREVDVTLVFVANETSLIYLNPNTDPFTANNNGYQLMDQNQNNTSQVIGAANYDIGHIFSTGGGGVAQLGCVCNDNNKAEGVTGSPDPTGDAFDVDFVSHEMGHQFGANHAFNDCNGNEHQSTAYEPGSGSSIMCYAGVCNLSNNLQAHSDDYFHAISLTEITNFLSNNGNSCAVSASISVDIPEFSSIDSSYDIPAQTPFELTGPTAHTVNFSDSLTYCWEEWDLGNFKQPEVNGAQFTAGPVFRTEYPVMNNSVRVFPKLLNLLNNQTSSPGERIPMVTRDMKFRLTVRNIKNGWGSFRISDDSLTLHITNTGSPFRVTSQDTTDITVATDTNITVTWDIAGTDMAPINCNSVNIYFSKDGGLTYPYLLAEAVPNNGFASVMLPDVSTSLGRIKVKGDHNVFFSLNAYNFTTMGSGTGIRQVILDKNLKVYPNPATHDIYIENYTQQPITALLFNQIGQKVWEANIGKTTSIHTTHFSRGIYLLKFTDEQNHTQVTKKIILR